MGIYQKHNGLVSLGKQLKALVGGRSYLGKGEVESSILSCSTSVLILDGYKSSGGPLKNLAPDSCRGSRGNGPASL